MNHRLGALLMVLVLALPIAAVAVHADTSPSTLIYVTNQVNLDYLGNAVISTSITVLNNGTSDTGALSLNVTYGGLLPSHVTNESSNFNVSNTVTGSSTTSYFFDIPSIGVGNSSQVLFTLSLTGMIQQSTGGVRTYNLTTFPYVSIPGATFMNATSFLVLPPGVTPTTNMTQFGFTQPVPSTLSYTLQFMNNTVPQVAFVPVSYVQPDILFTVHNSVNIDQFGWAYTDTLVTVNNTGQAASGALPVNITFFGLYLPYTWSQSSNFSPLSTQASDEATSYLVSVPSIAGGASAQVALHIKTWGMINEYSGGSYTYNFTNFPIVTIPGSALLNATSLVAIPVGTSLSSPLSSYGFVQQAPANPTFLQVFSGFSIPIPTVLGVNFTASSSNFGLFQIDSVQRTVGMAGDGSVMVSDLVTITNVDTQDVSTINLTLPASGQFALTEGYVDGGTVSLSNGLITLPVPISASSIQSFVLKYRLPASSVKDNSGTLQIDLTGALNFTNLIQSYSVVFGFPSGTAAQASTPTSFTNQTVMPAVVISAKVPLGWNLYLVTPALVGLLIAAAFIFFLYRRAEMEPFEEEGISIVGAKSEVVSSLLDLYRLRGDGFSPFDDYSAHRKILEEEKAKVAARMQDFKAKSLKDKAQKTLYDRMAIEDARFEQLYREGKASLEECLAGRLPVREFNDKVDKLKASAHPQDLLKKEPKQPKQ